MRIAEEGAVAELATELVMQGDLGAVVEGEGAAQWFWQAGQAGREPAADAGGSLVWEAFEAEQARGPLMGDQHILAVFGEGHQIGFPVTGDGAVNGFGGPVGDGSAPAHATG